MNQLLLRLFFAFMAWTAMHAHATGVLVLNEHLAKQDLAPYLVALEDADASLSIESARQLFSEGKSPRSIPKKASTKVTHDLPGGLLCRCNRLHNARRHRCSG